MVRDAEWINTVKLTQFLLFFKCYTMADNGYFTTIPTTTTVSI